MLRSGVYSGPNQSVIRCNDAATKAEPGTNWARGIKDDVANLCWGKLWVSCQQQGSCARHGWRGKAGAGNLLSSGVIPGPEHVAVYETGGGARIGTEYGAAGSGDIDPLSRDCILCGLCLASIVELYC